MKISKCIRKLEEIKKRFGDIDITGGSMREGKPLQKISVTDERGLEIFPHDPNAVAGKDKVEGVFFE